MCGIVGAVGMDARPTSAEADAILRTIEHRGPDSGGSRFVDGAWLGVRRLRILDLREAADQPAVDEASGVTLVFNGEIYNYVELRAELEAGGHRFRTTGDTEVLLRGWLEWGEDLFPRCNGMWAVAIHDPRSDGVLLSRDRYGEKPLFVGRGPGRTWWFGSEVAALRAGGAGSGRLDLTRAVGFLALGDTEDPAGSFFDGITQLPPGTLAYLTPSGLQRVRTWWSAESFVAESWGSTPPSSEEVLEALDRSVELRLRSDVEVGTSLSGGIDSSAVIASIRRLDPDRRIHTFTASFPEHTVDEWDRAALVAGRVNAVTHRVQPDPAAFVDELERLVLHQGAPIESPSVYAQWCVMRRAKEEGVTVLLDGQGADETWGGYPKYVWFALADALARGRAREAQRLVATWRRLGGLPHLAPRQVVGLALPRPLRSVAVKGTVAATRSLGPALRGVELPDPELPGTGPLLRRVAAADAGRVLLPRLLRYADRNSMAWSRELRLPFLDPAVAALGLRAGWSHALAEGWTKHALRRAAGERLPDEIVWRRDKTAYETPDARWLQLPAVAAAVDGARRSLVDNGLLSPGATSPSPWRVLSLALLMRVYDLRV